MECKKAQKNDILFLYKFPKFAKSMDLLFGSWLITVSNYLNQIPPLFGLACFYNNFCGKLIPNKFPSKNIMDKSERWSRQSTLY